MPEQLRRLGHDHQQPAVAVALVEVLVDHRRCSRPEPGRHLGHPLLGRRAAGPPNATMWDDWMLAPAEVPATTAPRSWAAHDGVAERGAADDGGQLELVAPVMKTPVAVVEQRDQAGSWASSRLSGRTATTSPAPSRRKSASYTSTTSGPSEEAVGITAIRASAPPLRVTNSREDRALAELVLGAADDHERSGWA